MAEEETEVKINLGCGPNPFPGFLNVDIVKYPGVDLAANAIDLKQIDSDSADFITAQHLLEYIPRCEMLPALKEWKRILKPGGSLEIRVTDLSQLMKAIYLNEVSKEMGMCHEMVISLIYGQQNNIRDIRFNGFTSELLQGILRGIDLLVVNAVIEGYDCIVTGVKQEEE